jgi:hypothetical protein
MKRFILFSVLLTMGLTSWSQTRLKLSFTGSPSVNWMNTSNQFADKQKIVLGYDFGLSGDIFFTENERYAINTGLQILNTGGSISYRTNAPFEFSGSNLPPSTKIRYRLRYVEVPLTIKLKTDQFHRTRYWGQFGMSTMINIGANGDSSDGTFEKDNIHDEINLFNIAMNVGLGFDFDLGGSNALSAGLIFHNGLTDVTTDNTFTDKTIINSLKIRLGLIF